MSSETLAVVQVAESELFRAIARDDSLATRVSNEIEQSIFENKLKPGYRLLSERELAERFGVSRTVIREAVRALSAKGLLEVRTGDGTFVRNGTHNSAADAISRLLRLAGARSPAQLRAVYEVRRPLEISIAGRAAECATPADLKALQDCLEEAQRTDMPERIYVDADLRFHILLAEATQNRLFVALLNSLGDVMSAIRRLGVAVEASRTEGCREHQLILDRVIAHDSEGAQAAMRAHMDAAERILVEAIARVEPEEKA